jgi:hypothetical protein
MFVMVIVPGSGMLVCLVLGGRAVGAFRIQRADDPVEAAVETPRRGSLLVRVAGSDRCLAQTLLPGITPNGC